MPKFKSLNDFYTWADKYEIKYEEKHEYSDTVPAGEVISYSYKQGEKIKLDEAIIVTISDGHQTKVPDLIGLSKSEAITKLEKAKLEYNFIYRNSSKKKNTVIDQSISSGSEISSGTTITVSLSNGRGDDEEEDEVVYNERRTYSNTTNNTTNNNSTNTNNNSSSNNYTPPTPSCNQCTITGIRGVISANIGDGYQAVANALTSEIKSQCPGIKVSISGDDTTGRRAGTFITGFSGGDTNSCSTVEIVLAK